MAKINNILGFLKIEIKHLKAKHLGIFHFFCYCKESSNEHGCANYLCDRLSCPLGTCPEMIELGQMVVLFLVFLEISIVVFTVDTLVSVTPTEHESSPFSISSPVFLIVYVPDDSHFN